MTEKRENDNRKEKDPENGKVPPENGKVPILPLEKSTPLALKYEDILLYVKKGFINIPVLCGKLKVSPRTIANRVRKLEALGLLARIKTMQPHKLILTQAGFQYLEMYFAKSLERVHEGGQGIEDVRAFETTPRTDLVPFDTLPFLETIEEYILKKPSHYPKFPLFKVKAHWVRYKFPITSQDRYLTNYGMNERGSLANQDWCSVIRMKNHYQYYGTLEFHNIKYQLLITRKNVTVRFKPFFSAYPEEAFERILQMVFDVKRELEDRFSTSRGRFRLGDIDNLMIAYCIGQHYGIQLTPLSVICDLLGVAYEDKAKRIRIDASQGIPETELTHRGFGKDDTARLFNDLRFQVVNEYGVQEAHNEIKSNSIKSENQYLSLLDQSKLGNQRMSVIESSVQQIYSIQAKQAQLNYDSVLNLTLQDEQLEERLASFTLVKRSMNEQRILTFLQQNQGVTRNEISTSLSLKLSSVCGYITKMKKAHLIREEKVKRQRGKLFSNTQSF